MSSGRRGGLPGMSDDDLVRLARDVIDTNRYVTLATSCDDGTPWATPVYFNPHEYRTLYWVSSPDAQHSVNLAARPALSMVVFDSSVAVGGAQAVYLSGHAAAVAEDELEDACAVAFPPRFAGARAFAPAVLRAPEHLRLYRATVDRAWVLIKGNDPIRGSGVDARAEVDLH